MTNDFISIMHPSSSSSEKQSVTDFIVKHWRKFFFFGLAPLMLLSPWIFAFGYITYISIRDYPEQIQFDPSKWKDKALVKTTDPIRIHMIDDLKQNYRLEGMKKAELLDILGEPDRNLEFPGWDIVYWLGPERGPFGIDSEWLAIRLNDQQEVSDYKIVTD